uniref:extracellular matrix protein 1 n=1 Tax=Myxine glutinosa TaxID=7769 RepID=UPI00358E3D90
MAIAAALILVGLLCVHAQDDIVQKPVKPSVPKWLLEQLQMNEKPSALKPDSESCGLEPRTIKVQPPFPPGKPNEMNIAAICNTDRPPLDRGFVLPNSAFGFLRRKVEMLRSLNAAFSGCCSQDESQRLNCATDAWINALIIFCDHETQVKDNIHQCCAKEGSAVHRCFAVRAPDPDYTGASPDSRP